MTDGPEIKRRPPTAEPLLLYGGTVITMDPEWRIIPHGEVLLSDGRVAAVGRALTAVPGTRLLDVTGSFVLPGLIQSHVHLGQTIFRGLAEQRSLLPWLRERILPLEAAHDDDSAYWSTLLGAAECLLSGTTTVNDIGVGLGIEGHLRALADSRLRALTGKLLMDAGDDLPTSLVEGTDAALDHTAALGQRWHGTHSGRMRWSLNPRWILSASDALWEGIRELADDHGWPVHTHALEHADETAAVRQARGGRDEIAYFADKGLLEVDLRIAHGVQLDDAGLRQLAEHDVSVLHCPAANLKLGSGIADVVALEQAGVSVGVGCDGPPCNNHLDLLEEARLGARLQMLGHGPQAVSGRDVLRWATIGSARAIGLESSIGSIEVGKLADLLVLGEDTGLWAAPGSDPHDLVAYSAGRGHVRHVFVEGEQLVDDGRLTHLDDGPIRSETSTVAKALWRRSSLA